MWPRGAATTPEMKGRRSRIWNGDCIPRCVYAYNVSNKTTDKTIYKRNRTDATYNTRASVKYRALCRAVSYTEYDGVTKSK